MPKALQITSRLNVTPLLDIHHPPFEKLYQNGVYRSLFKERHTRPMTDSYMLKNVRESLTDTDFDGQQGFWLPIIGFHFGRLHGAILSAQTGNPRMEVTALARFENDHARRGYDVGREWYFVESLLEQPDERTYTDASLLERLQEIECESAYFHDGENTWYYAIGCILGELSGQLFPATSEEYGRWEADLRFWKTEAERTARRAVDTEPLDPVPVVEYTV